MNPADRLQALEGMLRHALQQVHVLRLRVIAGDATFEQAAETVRDLAECLATFCVPPSAKYFLVDDIIYKFESDKPVMFRMETEKGWDRSTYKTLEQFLATPGEALEITQEKGEP